MVALKMGNPEIHSFSKGRVRAKYGIPSESVMIHLYLGEKQFSDARNFLRKLSGSVDLILVSLSMEYTLEELKQNLDRNYKFFKISELKADSRKLTKAQASGPYPIIILNDSRGRMPEFHSASDACITLGPNNFFESLAAKCPTLVMPGMSFQYELQSWERMVQIGQATHGLIASPSMDEALNRLPELLTMDRNRIEHPAFVIPKGENQSSYEHLLDDLSHLIRAQLGEVQ
jgi:hypothetical protein